MASRRVSDLFFTAVIREIPSRISGFHEFSSKWVDSFKKVKILVPNITNFIIVYLYQVNPIYKVYHFYNETTINFNHYSYKEQ